MDAGAEQSIGVRVRRARLRKGWSQKQFADFAGRSLSWLKGIEQGRIPLDRMSVITHLAAVLSCEVSDLTGQPYRDTAAEVNGAIPAIRRELMLTATPPAAETTPRPVDDIAAEVGHASRLRQDSALVPLAELAPGLLGDLRVLVHTHAGERAYALLAEVCGAADMLAYKTGWLDLSWLAIERLTWAADRSGDPLWAATAAWQRAGRLVPAGVYRDAEALVDATAGQVEPAVTDAQPEALSLWGALHLRGAVSAARRGNAPEAHAHLDEAADTAARLEEDRNDYQLAFGPSNVAIHRTAVAVELGDGPAAVEHGANLQLPSHVPRERVAHHHIDLGRGLLWTGRRDAALRSWLHAERHAPLQTRAHPMVREGAHTLLEHDRRRRNNLRSFALRVGAM